MGLHALLVAALEKRSHPVERPEVKIRRQVFGGLCELEDGKRDKPIATGAVVDVDVE